MSSVSIKNPSKWNSDLSKVHTEHKKETAGKEEPVIVIRSVNVSPIRSGAKKIITQAFDMV